MSLFYVFVIYLLDAFQLPFDGAGFFEFVRPGGVPVGDRQSDKFRLEFSTNMASAHC